VPLQKARPFQVVVHEPDGRPASGVTVRIGFELLVPSEVWPTTDPGRWRPRTRLARTDENGRVVLSRGAEEQWLDVYVPGVHVQVREPDRASLTLPERRGLSLLVQDEDGPVAGVVALDRGLPIAVSGAGGTLRGEVGPDGRLTLLAPDGRFQRIETPPADGETAVVRLSPLERVVGRVLTADGERPVPGAWVWYQLPRATATDVSGVFVLSLSPWPSDRELVFLAAAAPGYLPVLERVPLRGTEAALRLRRADELSGRVVDGSGMPLPDVEVEAVARDAEIEPRWRRSVTTRSGPGGRFRLRSLTAGSVYRLVASSDGMGPAVRPVRAGSIEPVELGLTQLASVSGRVVSVEGQPLRCAEVELTPAEGDTASQEYLFRELRVLRRARSGSDGRFRLPDVPAGRWNLSVRRAGFRIAIHSDIAVGPSDEVVLADLALKRDSDAGRGAPSASHAAPAEPCGSGR
jgi:hypothetical protein